MPRNPWFETIAEAQRRARKRLPYAVYGALLAGSERGSTVADNVGAFAELGFAPRVAGHHAVRDLRTSVLGMDSALPVLISPTGVQAVHPDGELAVARAAAARGLIMGLSSFASQPVETIVAANPNTAFQIYWSGGRDTIVQRMERARAAGCRALIVTLDWSFSEGRDWGSPAIPDRVDLRTMLRMTPDVLPHPGWLWRFARAGRIPDLTTPNMRRPDGGVPTFFGAYREWRESIPPTWEDIGWLVRQWDGPLLLKGVSRVDDARRAVDAGVTAVSVSNHGGNNLDTTPATIRLLPSIAAAVGDQIEVLLDGGIRRGGDVAKALALGARAVLIGRAYLWGLAANGQAGVENVLDILRGGLDSAVLGLGHATPAALSPDDLVIPDGFTRSPGTAPL
ncbi:mycofactocin biosynthesis FMN-dependent deaminase MftD [Winogradskya consettensis]|uniref:Mycofactocin system heme/flavin oxidoreductase MftD n=1 Tax=Winogradskya consettensis TaxID=113560 RepID=A0A919T1A7_9ACTN|nr:pre-mycofactocin synthase MftD [Actinoplanes consettensis]GIM82082.1 putative mycofactocin system heme/flavin oxidoreductase MftD [Actinoplanes consettensis]